MGQSDAHAEKYGAADDRSEDFVTDAGHVRLLKFDDWRIGGHAKDGCAAAHVAGRRPSQQRAARHADGPLSCASFLGGETAAQP